MTQKSREALIEILLLSLYLDNRLSQDEDAVMNETLNSIGWESTQPREVFTLRAFANAWEASNCELKTAEFLEPRLNMIEADGAQVTAFMWLSKVLGADGFAPEETLFLSKIEKRFFP